MRGEHGGFLLLVVAFTLPPLIRPGFAGPPSPEGEGFGAVELGDCLRKRTGSAGACPRPTKGTFSLFKLLSHIEPGDPLRCGSTNRVTGSHCQRPLAAKELFCLISSAVVFSALELGCVYALVALALFLSFRVLNIAVAFTLPPLIRPGFAGPPSPEGEGFGEVELGECLRKRTGSAGACPRPTNGAFPLLNLLSHIEPGDTLRCGSTNRVTGSHCQRPLAARVTP